MYFFYTRDAIKYKAKFWDGSKYCHATITYSGDPFYEVLDGEHRGNYVHVFDIKEKTRL